MRLCDSACAAPNIRDTQSLERDAHIGKLKVVSYERLRIVFTGMCVNKQLYQTSAHSPILLAMTILTLGVGAVLARLFHVRRLPYSTAALRVE